MESAAIGEAGRTEWSRLVMESEKAREIGVENSRQTGYQKKEAERCLPPPFVSPVASSLIFFLEKKKRKNCRSLGKEGLPGGKLGQCFVFFTGYDFLLAGCPNKRV